MIKWFCENPDCGNYMKSLTMGKVRYQMKDGKLIPEGKVCPSCGQPLAYSEKIEPGPFKVNIGEFAGMNPSQKSEVLKKRYVKKQKEEGAQEKINHYRNKALKKFFNE